MKRKILAVLVGILGVLIFVTRVHAKENDSSLTTQYIDGIYSYHYRNGILSSYGKLPFRYQNGQLAYCIEPNRVINNKIYSSTEDWNITGYDENVKKQMELISYYGYKYQCHDDIKYYIATQELIWLFSDDYIIWKDTFSTDGNAGNTIDIEKEKNEILDLVKKHELTPSFSGNCYTQMFGETLTLIDYNNVLSEYEISTDLPYKKQDNYVIIQSNKFGMNNITLTKKSQNNNITKVYYVVGDSQMMAIFGMQEQQTSFSIKTDNVNVRINKRDKSTKNLIPQAGTKFKITGKSIEYIETDENGYASINLPVGKYEIEEIKAPNGYVLNSDKKIFEINDDIKLNDIYLDIDIYNDKPSGKISIEKTDENNNFLEGVEIGLFDSDHNKISSIITKKDNSYFDNLKLGTYYIKELNTLSGYILDDKEYKVDLEYVDDNTYTVEKNIKIVNEKIKCDIVYITSSGSELLKGVKIGVYDENDNLVFTGKTNKDGKVIIKNLPYGKYYIKQIKVPSGYILNEDEYIFYVNDSTCLSEINIQNEKTIMPVTSTSLNKCIVFAFILSSLGIFNYVKKSN